MLRGHGTPKRPKGILVHNIPVNEIVAKHVLLRKHSKECVCLLNEVFRCRFTLYICSTYP